MVAIACVVLIVLMVGLLIFVIAKSAKKASAAPDPKRRIYHDTYIPLDTYVAPGDIPPAIYVAPVYQDAFVPVGPCDGDDVAVNLVTPEFTGFGGGNADGGGASSGWDAPADTGSDTGSCDSGSTDSGCGS